MAAYNDSTGITLNPQTGNPSGNFSQNGLALSNDDGATWIRKPQMPLPPGVTELDGDPWLAVHPTQPNVVYYTSIATVNGGIPFGRVAVSKSTDGGDTWSVADVSIQANSECSPRGVDKPTSTVDMNGNLYVAFVCVSNAPYIRVAKFSNFGMPTQTLSEVGVAGSFIAQVAAVNPIIRADYTLASHVALIYQADDGVNNIIRYAETNNSGLTFNTLAVPVMSRPIQPTAWPAQQGAQVIHDTYSAFDIDPNGSGCWTAYEWGGRVYLTETTNGASWTPPQLVPRYGVGWDQFQPQLRVAQDGTIGIAFYENDGIGNTTVSMVTTQPVPNNYWNLWTQVKSVTSNNGPICGSAACTGTVPFVSCTTGTWNKVPGYPIGTQFYFGDYMGIVPLQYNPFFQPNTFGYYSGVFSIGWTDSRLTYPNPSLCRGLAFQAAPQHAMAASVHN